MFDATKARKITDDAVEADTDLFAAELEDRFKTMSITKRQTFMRLLREVVADPDSVTAFVQGTYAQNNAGQPALQLGGNPNDKKPLDQAYDTIQADPTVPAGLKMALKRMAVPSDPDYIKVEDDGTPSEVKMLRQQVADLTRERDTLQKAGDEFVKLLDAVKAESGLNPNTGEESDAFVKRAFKTKSSGAPAPADMIKKADLKKAADEAIKAVQAEKAPTIGKVIEGHDAALKAVQALVDLAK